jgi:hypothetical protein
VDDYERWITCIASRLRDGDVTKYLRIMPYVARTGRSFPKPSSLPPSYRSVEIGDLTYDETRLEETLRPLRDHRYSR